MRSAYTIALCALFAALGVAVMIAAGLILFVFGLDIEIEGTGFMVALYIALVAVMLLFDFALQRMTPKWLRRWSPFPTT